MLWAGLYKSAVAPDAFHRVVRRVAGFALPDGSTWALVGAIAAYELWLGASLVHGRHAVPASKHVAAFVTLVTAVVAFRQDALRSGCGCLWYDSWGQRRQLSSGTRCFL